MSVVLMKGCWYFQGLPICLQFKIEEIQEQLAMSMSVKTPTELNLT